MSKMVYTQMITRGSMNVRVIACIAGTSAPLRR